MAPFPRPRGSVGREVGPQYDWALGEPQTILFQTYLAHSRTRAAEIAHEPHRVRRGERFIPDGGRGQVEVCYLALL